MMTLDQCRASWIENVRRLRVMPCENTDPDALDAIEWAIRRFPYSEISDAVMQVNGGWLCGLKYELCIAWLLQAGCLEPAGSGLFRINRCKLPLIHVDNPIADAIDEARRGQSAGGNRNDKGCF